MNSKPNSLVEIGTSDGKVTVLKPKNVEKDALIYTINIPSKNLERGEGGFFTTWGLSEVKVGYFYKKESMKNIKELFVNTANWIPEM